MDNDSRHPRTWIWLTLLVVSIVLLQTAWLAHAAPPKQSAEEGEALFQQYCAGCHTVGGGDLVGPDLEGIATRREADWLEHWLAEPDKMIADGDPIAMQLLEQYNNVPMPNQHLTLSEIDSLLMYLGAAEPAHTAAQTQPEALVGNPQAGKNLFTGAADFQGGGAACISCHNVAGLSLPGGGLLGPDLTQAVQRYGGEAGLRGVLNTIAFPSMVPVYQNSPLTPQEQADLTAFLAESAATEAPKRGLSLLVTFIIAFGTLDVFLGLLFVWQSRLPQRSRRTLSRTKRF